MSESGFLNEKVVDRMKTFAPSTFQAKLPYSLGKFALGYVALFLAMVFTQLNRQKSRE